MMSLKQTLFSALLLPGLIGFTAGAPPALGKRADFSCTHAADPSGGMGICDANLEANGWCQCSDGLNYAQDSGSNPCPYTTPPPSGPITLLSEPNCPPPSTTATAIEAPATSAPRTKCNQDECPKFCSIGSDDMNTSLEGKREFENPLVKRFYENSDADKFPYELLKQSYTRNICPSSPQTNMYIWKGLSTQRGDYAAALQGLSGCTTIFAASGKGVFSSHIWEEDKVNSPPKDLQENNYKATMEDLTKELSKHKDDLDGGEAFLIIPKDPENTDNNLYDQAIVDALVNAIKSASGITPQIMTYIPEDFATSETLGEDRKGTFSFQFDPKYKPGDGDATRAYRIIGEGVVYSEKTGLGT
ncbi:MAG: hypothetical protein Q9163_002991 [Psora crenata]